MFSGAGAKSCDSCVAGQLIKRARLRAKSALPVCLWLIKEKACAQAAALVQLVVWEPQYAHFAWKGSTQAKQDCPFAPHAPSADHPPPAHEVVTAHQSTSSLAH